MTELEIKTGYLYLLKNNILGGYKVGITTAPTSRFRALGVGSKSTLIGYWQLNAYRELEKQLHKEYAGLRVPQSEWFNLSDQDIRDVIQKITSIATTEFLMPEFAQSFVGPQYKIITVPPYKQAENANWQMFCLLVLAFVAGYLLPS
jgi:hypothetical protein